MPTNRLTAERSPYLRQHAHNPVEWYPWGPEALTKAEVEDKPILLSIGYAACHWCHVMERESFEDEGIAELMNERFINIKVDREERPDLDQIYQQVVQVMGRSGGWPLTVFLTPNQMPYFAGTYFPPQDRFGMPGFPAVLHALADAYRAQRKEVEEQAQEITEAIRRISSPSTSGGTVTADALGRASQRLLAHFDLKNGGFGGQPKFPNTMCLDVLLEHGVVDGYKPALEAVERALDRMRAGGIWDHLRGGFHRYSTDERWLVPHFEKMLYDNALLLKLYVDGYRVFRKELYAETARAIVLYLFAEMRDPSGAFYATQDADSEGHEGTFFVWTQADLRAALGDGVDCDVARLHFGITEEGNFEDTGATVLSEVSPIEQVAVKLGLPVETALQALSRARGAMLGFREKRPRPLRDDKVLASLNGLVIGALAEAGRVLDEPTWVNAAEEAFAAIEAGLVRNGRVGRYLKDGERASDRAGFLDDHAYLGNAAIDLYEATLSPRYVTIARAIARQMIEHHHDVAAGGFFFAPDDGDVLIARTKDAFDQAIPAASSTAAILCLRLGTLVDPALTTTGLDALTAVAAKAVENPFGMAQAVLAIDRAARGSTEVVLVGSRAEADSLLRATFATYVPNRAIAHVDHADSETTDAASAVAVGKAQPAEGAVAYVCRDRTCSLPVTDPEDLRRLLRTPSPSGR